jgi:hypothetical protein
LIAVLEGGKAFSDFFRFGTIASNKPDLPIDRRGRQEGKRKKETK